MHISKKYPQLNDSVWLHQKYVVEKLSTIQIAKIIGAKSENSVRQFLIKTGIPTRNLREAIIINSKDDHFKINHDFIEGGLLGDAGLRMYNKESSICKPYFYKKNKFYDHLAWVAENIFSENHLDNITEEYRNINGKDLKYFILRSLSHDELLPYFIRWYPASSGYKKRIPADVNISPTSLLNCFMDDGSSYNRIRNNKTTNQTYARISLQGFPKEDLIMLIEKIYKEYNLKISLHKCGDGFGNELEITQGNIKHFYEIIGHCPIDSLQYKWK